MPSTVSVMNFHENITLPDFMRNMFIMNINTKSQRMGFTALNTYDTGMRDISSSATRNTATAA